MRKIFGYLRYDTYQELAIMNDLYRNELRLYKNFFQSVMKFQSKEGIGGRVKRKYEVAKTPYQRLIASNQIPEEVIEELRRTYLSPNPTELKSSTGAKIAELYQAYKEKKGAQHVDPHSFRFIFQLE